MWYQVISPFAADSTFFENIVCWSLSKMPRILAASLPRLTAAPAWASSPARCLFHASNENGAWMGHQRPADLQGVLLDIGVRDPLELPELAQAAKYEILKILHRLPHLRLGKQLFGLISTLRIWLTGSSPRRIENTRLRRNAKQGRILGLRR